MHKNTELTLALIQKVQPVAKECFRNSVIGLFAYRGDALYVEGWLMICDGTLPIAHGWLEIDEQIVDVTVLDVDAEFYHPVFRYTRHDLEKVGRRDHAFYPIFELDRETRRQMNEVQFELYQPLFQRKDAWEE